MAEQKLIGYVIAIGLCVVMGIFFYMGWSEETPEAPEGAMVSVAPPEPDDMAATGAVPQRQTAEQPLPAELSGKILISKRPVQVLAAPDTTASAMYGFPAGRPFRAVSREGDFIRIQDVKSGASGWIEEAALAPAPAPAPKAAAPRAAPSAPSSSKKSSSAKAVAPKATTQAAAEPEAKEPEPQKRRGGLFGGQGPIGGLLDGMFGPRQ